MFLVRMMPANCLPCQQQQRSRASCQKICPTSSSDCGLTAASRAASHGPESISSTTLLPSECLNNMKYHQGYYVEDNLGDQTLSSSTKFQLSKMHHRCFFCIACGAERMWCNVMSKLKINLTDNHISGINNDDILIDVAQSVYCS